MKTSKVLVLQQQQLLKKNSNSSMPIGKQFKLSPEMARHLLDQKVALIFREWEELDPGATSITLRSGEPTLLSDLLAEGEGTAALFLIPDFLKNGLYQDLCTKPVKEWVQILVRHPYAGTRVKTLPSFAKALGKWAEIWKTGDQESISKVATSICWAIETEKSNKIVRKLINQFTSLYVGAMQRGGAEELVAKRAIRDLYIGDQQRPLIHYLICMKHAGFGHLRVLVNKKIDLNRIDNGITPLGLAVHEQIKPTINLLIKAGVDLDEGYDTPLGLAAQQGNRSLVRRLMKEGASLYRQSGDDYLLPVELATKKSVKRLLLELELFEAVKRGLIEKIVSLANRGVNLNALDSKKLSPLSRAIQYGHNKALLALLAKGADPNVGHALEIAAGLGDVEVVKVLLDKGANDRAKALTSACAKGRADVVEYLIKVGTKITPNDLTAAISSGSIQTLRALRSRLNTLHLKQAIEYRQNRVVQFLVEEVRVPLETKQIVPLLTACRANEGLMVKCLVENGALTPVMERDEWQTVQIVLEKFCVGYKEMLNEAARAGAPNTLGYLLGRGFGVHAKIGGWTPLSSLFAGRAGRAVRKRDVDTAARLIRVGATIDPKDMTIEMAKVGKEICEKAGVWK